MKKYFVKYLPVKGEIKEGDKGIMFLKNNIPIPHKLFLCSRDIQVGDEITYIGEPITHWEAPETQVLNKKLGDKSTCINDKINSKGEFWTKVIGEISSEATWVKEGDEFQEEEIKIRKFSAIRREMTPELPEVRVEVKCKCCNTYK